MGPGGGDRQGARVSEFFSKYLNLKKIFLGGMWGVGVGGGRWGVLS